MHVINYKKPGSHSYTCCDGTSGLPCSLFLYWHFVFCNNPVHARWPTDSRQLSSIIQAENVSSHSHACMVYLRPALQPVSVHVLALCAFCITLCMQSDTTDRTAVIDYTKKTCQQSSAHAVMCLVPQVLQPVSVHVLALCAFCNNPVHAQVTTDSRQPSSIASRLENMSVIHTHAVMCLVPQVSLLCRNMYWHFAGSAITLCMHKWHNRGK
jgi:hypothetical protein